MRCAKLEHKRNKSIDQLFMSKRFQLISAVHLVLTQNDRVLLLRRFQTGWMDGHYSMVAGHLDGQETMTQAMVREAKEEAGLIIDPKDLELVHMMHRASDSERIDVFFRASTWQGEPVNQEPHKCDALRWFDMHQLPQPMVPYIRDALVAIMQNQHYSEHGW